MATATPSSAAKSHKRSDAKPETTWPLRAALVATTSYVASSDMICKAHSNLIVYIDWAAIDYTSIEAAYEVSPDGTTWRSLPMRDAIASVLYPTSAWRDSFTIANFPDSDGGATFTYGVAVPVSVPAAHYFRVQIKRTGGTAVGTVAVTVQEGTAL